jgi:hypothetical protein
MNKRPLQPLQPQHLLSQKNRFLKRNKIFFIHLQWFLNNSPSNLERTGWWNRFNPTSNRFLTIFHRPSSTTSPTRNTTHQELDSENSFPSSLRTQCNGGHFFLRGEDLSRWILEATHLFQLASLSFFNTFFYNSL